jgi:hypothetical protein
LTDEATKTNRLRSDEFKSRYFSGRIIDIGCGPDPVVPHAVFVDQQQGDAQWVLDHFDPESFDCVHSSHCLEHMKNVEIAICNKGRRDCVPFVWYMQPGDFPIRNARTRARA